MDDLALMRSFVCVCVHVCAFKDSEIVAERGLPCLRVPICLTLILDGSFTNSKVGKRPHPSPHPHPLAVRPHLPHRRDDNKHVSRHTPGQSAIRFTVHEIWWCFYWSKDLSVIIYRLLPRRLWCQRAPCALERISRGGGVKEIVGEGWWLCWGLEI